MAKSRWAALLWLVYRKQMNESNFQLANGFVSKAYIDQAHASRHTRERMIETLLTQRRMPTHGWDDMTIELFLSELAAMDSNNFIDNIGVGEREARMFSGIVRRRNFQMGHGMGRSGDLGAIQPKAAGSSLIAQLTRHMVLDAIKVAGIKNAEACLVLPLATGMALSLSLLTLRSQRPAGARYVLWPRMDQKTCLKAIYTSGLEAIVIPNRLEGDEVRTDLAALESEIVRLGADRIVGVVSTSSCFAPRVPDRVVEIARLCKKHGIGHIINNAYGIQCALSCDLVSKAGRCGRVDCFVQSSDKNFLVPVGGSIVAAFEPAFIDALSENYPGRASIAPITDLFITLLSMGSNGFRDLLRQREELMVYFREKLGALAASLGERLLVTDNNPISMGISISRFDVGGKSATYLGSMLFSRFCSGVRTVSANSAQKICGHSFPHYGSHLDDAYPCAYLTVACGLGMQRSEIDTFCTRLQKVCQQFLKQRERKQQTSDLIRATAALAASAEESAAAESAMPVLIPVTASSFATSANIVPAASASSATSAASAASTACASPSSADGSAQSNSHSLTARVVSAHSFAGNSLDRSRNLKTAAAGAEAASSPGARFIIVHSKRALCQFENSSAVRLPLTAILAASGLGIESAAHLFESSCPCLCVLLGLGSSCEPSSPQWVFALDVSSAFPDDATAIAALIAASDLSASSALAFTATRALLSTIGGAELAVIGQATALLEWNRTARFCGACGSPTLSIECGLKRQCSRVECRSRLYPRTDPVVIALVIDAASGRALLGRSKNFRANMYSTLAGFAEQGESLEEAVRREVSEESGLSCGRCIYHSSQPWPIGRGGGNELMIGFIVEALSVDIAVDPNELEDARWFSCDEVRAASQWTGGSAAVAAPESSGTAPAPLSIPGSYAIAHHLIQHWLDTPLEQLARAFRD